MSAVDVFLCQTGSFFPGSDLVRLESCSDRPLCFSFCLTYITELVYLQLVSVAALVLIVFSPSMP